MRGPRDMSGPDDLIRFIEKKVVNKLQLLSPKDFNIYASSDTRDSYKRFKYEFGSKNLQNFFQNLRNGGTEFFSFGALHGVSINHDFCDLPTFGPPPSEIGDNREFKVPSVSSPYSILLLIVCLLLVCHQFFSITKEIFEARTKGSTAFEPPVGEDDGGHFCEFFENMEAIFAEITIIIEVYTD